MANWFKFKNLIIKTKDNKIKIICMLKILLIWKKMKRCLKKNSKKSKKSSNQNCKKNLEYLEKLVL